MMVAGIAVATLGCLGFGLVAWWVYRVEQEWRVIIRRYVEGRIGEAIPPLRDHEDRTPSRIRFPEDDSVDGMNDGERLEDEG